MEAIQKKSLFLRKLKHFVGEGKRSGAAMARRGSENGNIIFETV
jgi:hypothetical protein